MQALPGKRLNLPSNFSTVPIVLAQIQTKNSEDTTNETTNDFSDPWLTAAISDSVSNWLQCQVSI